MRKIFSFITILSLTLLVGGCETEDDRKLSDAQECLDKLRDSDSDAEALACSKKIKGMSSSESFVIRCSVDFFVGGVKASQVARAVDEANDLPANKKAGALMGYMTQDTEAEAATTYSDCVKSGVASLIYMASISQIGTELIISVGQNPDDLDNLNVDAAIANCQTPGNCNDTVVGNAVINMYDIYCVGGAEDSSVCQDMSAALAQGGNNPDAVAQALFDLLAN